jgi:putative transcriptional regulator
MSDMGSAGRVRMSFMVLLAALVWMPQSGAEDGDRTLLLVAKPGLPDPNFRDSVVLATQVQSGETAGVIINRPTNHSLASILPGEQFNRFTEPVFFGGPVMSQALFAVFRAEKRIGDSKTLLPGVYFALEASTLDELMHHPPQSIRFYAGMSGWSAGQLRAEIERGDWFVLNADADIVFTRDHDIKGLWSRLLRMARTITAGIAAPSGGQQVTFRQREDRARAFGAAGLTAASAR